MSKATGTTDLPLERLRGSVRGTVIGPAEGDYDEARQVFYGGYERRPEAIVRALDADDVAVVISFARETGAELAVRSGGHSVVGHGTTEGGIVLDLSRMRALEIDPDAHTVWTEPGLTTAEYSAAANEHGLGTSFGDAGSVGIGGITIGGGIGYLVRSQGLTIDSLLAAEVVTADGTRRRVDAETEPDLFWAIRGGGGNFGVVTRLQLRLHPLGDVVGGMLMLPATAETIAGWIELAEAAPEELSTIANVMPAMPMEPIPEEHHGKLAIMGMVVHTGDREAGERALAPFRALAEPYVDATGPMAYPSIYDEPEPEEGAEPFHPLAAHRSFFIDELGDERVQTILEHLADDGSGAMMRACQLRVLGGAMARVPADATAFGHRDRRIMVAVASLYPDLSGAEVHQAWAAEFAGALRDGPGVYVNFLAEEGEEGVRAAYPGDTWDRLRRIKAEYDPDNLFRLNQNIPPAGTGAGSKGP